MHPTPESGPIGDHLDAFGAAAPTQSSQVRYLVVGGGIAGLAAAWELTQQVPAEQVAVIEATDRVGGKLRGATIAGLSVDVGAESVLARRPEAVDLINEAGLTQDVVHPEPVAASIVADGRLQPLPRRTLMGVPADPRLARGVLSEVEVDRAIAEVLPAAPPVGAAAVDISVGDLVAARLGDAVVDRIVEPLLGGVYAGHARLTSTAAALPALLSAYRNGTSILAAIDAIMPAPAADHATAPAPRQAPAMFAGIRGGVHRLPTAIAEQLAVRGAQVITGTVARELHREGSGWRVVTGAVPDPREIRADHVILALPPAPTERLLRAVAPAAAAALGQVETASMVVVTLAFAAGDLPELPGSGLLVPPVEGRDIKASTFSANKWGWVAEAGRGAGPDGVDVTVVRTSLGRHRQEADLQRDDAELIHRSLHDLSELLGSSFPEPLDAHVQRWGGGLPQYAVGHLDLVAAVREEIAAIPGLALAGATYGGVGIPACIASGRAAAAELLEAAGLPADVSRAGT